MFLLLERNSRRIGRVRKETGRYQEKRYLLSLSLLSEYRYSASFLSRNIRPLPRRKNLCGRFRSGIPFYAA
jgi:hypothetical protein